MKLKSVAVFCGSSSGNDKDIVSSAYELGQFLAEQGITLVYGGGKVGLMGQVAQGTLDAGGQVIGVIPNFLKQKEVHFEAISELIVVDTMHERKLKMHELSDGAIMLPGGFGTFEEFFELLTWGQLGLHQKPLGILNINGFYDALLQMFNKMVNSQFLKPDNRDRVLVDDQIDGLHSKMDEYTFVGIPKWI